MIEFTAVLWRWSGGQGSWHFLTIPPDEAVEIRLESSASAVRRGFGSVRVEAKIASVAWTTSIFPQKDGGYILPVKAEVRRRAAIATGDEVTAAISIL